MFLADAVGGKLFVAPLADFFRVRAGEDFDDVIQSHAKTVFLADAIDAREKFLRRQRAIERGARRKAIVARATTCFGRAGRLVSLAVQQHGPTIIFAEIRQ